jgi:endonuclease G
MAKNKRSSGNALARLFNQNGVKMILGLVAAGSFAFAFGQEKIQQLVAGAAPSNAACLDQFYRDAPPYLMKDSLNKHSYPLCFNGFNVMYSGVSKTPLWVAEALTPSRLSQKIPREDSFHEETRVNADMPNKEAQFDSFSLANMVPQAPKNNQQVWRELEEATRALAVKQKQDVYVVTGPVFAAKKLKTIGKGVIVPTAVFKALYLPKTGAAGAYYAPNDNSQQVKIVSICYLEEQLGINLFPQLS